MVAVSPPPRGRALSGPLLALGLGVLAALAMPAARSAEPAAAQANVSIAVRAGTHPGFGRLVLDWPGPVDVEHRQRGRELVLAFEQPFAADLAAARTRLGDYLERIEADAAGRTLRLRLAPGVRASLPDFEPDLVVVDLERREPRPEPDAGRGVAVRTGEHDGFTRVVFDWPGPVTFSTEAHGRTRIITFDRQGEIDAMALGQRLRSRLDGLTASEDETGSAVRFHLKPGVDARVFKVEERQVVVDLSEGGGAPETGLDDDGVPSGGRPAPPAGAGVGVRAPPPAAASGSAPPATGDRAAPGSAATPAPLEVAATATDGGIALRFTWPRPVPAAFFVRAGHLWAVFDAPRVDGEVVFPPPLEGAGDHFGPAEVVPAGAATALRFPLRRDLAAEVAREGGAWRVALRGTAAPPQAVPMRRLDGPPRLRLVAPDGGALVELADPTVGDRLTIWPLLRPGFGRPGGRRLVEAELLPTAQGLVWRARSDRLVVTRTPEGMDLGAPEGLLLSRPDEGAEIAAVAEAQETERRAPEDAGESPDTAVGGEVGAGTVPASPPPNTGAQAADGDEGSADAAEGREIPLAPPEEVAGPEHATASGDAARAGDEAAPSPVGPPLGLAKWTLGADETVADRRARLLVAIEAASSEGRPLAELNLARFFLAQAMAAETLAVLGSRSTDDDLGESPLEVARQGLSGAAELLMGHLRQAAAALEAPELDGDREIALWRAALAAAENDWPRAAKELGRAEDTLETYPPALQLRLGLPAALIAVESGSPARAFAVLEQLSRLDLHTVDRARVAFIKGLAHARTGALEQADRIWRTLEGNPDNETRIKAEFARTTMLLDAGRIDAAEALARLAPAQPLWRGHPWELTMLEGLGQMQAEAGDLAGAIRTWKKTLRRFPDAPRAAEIVEMVRSTLMDAMLGDRQTIDPLRALALYRDFPDLFPDDEAGIRIRRRLAERLADVDLVEPAAALLAELVGAREDPAARAELGADLAALWLRAPDPPAALAALERSAGGTALPAGLADRRAVLRARVLAALDREGEALELLAGRHDRSAARVRLTVHWRHEAWPEVIRTVEAMLVDKDDAAALDEEERALVLRLAVARGRLGDTEALIGLRARFGAAMRGTPAEPAFLVATMTPGRAVEPAAILAAAEERIGALERFLAQGGAKGTGLE